MVTDVVTLARPPAAFSLKSHRSLFNPPEELWADLGFTTDAFFFLSFFLYSSAAPALAERNSTKTGHIMLGSECDL